MPRVTPVFRPGDYPGTPDADTLSALDAMFDRLFPGVAEPCIDAGHAGIAIAALNPALADRLGDMSRFMALDLAFSQRRDLRELAIQTVNLAQDCRFAFDARVPACMANGVGRDMLDAMIDWRGSTLFDAQQKLVIEHAENVVGNAVTDESFSRLVAAFGERGAVECTAVIAFWSFWALFLNATGAGR